MTMNDKIPTNIAIPLALHADIQKAAEVLSKNELFAALHLKPTQIIKLALARGLKLIIEDAA